MPRDLLAGVKRPPRDLLATSAPAAPPQPDFIGAAMRSNPMTSAVAMGLSALGTNPTQAVQQTMSGINEGAGPDTLELPRNILSLGPELMNAIFKTNFKGADWMPDFGGEALRSGMTNTGMIKPPTNNIADRFLRSTGESVGGALVPETALVSKAGGTLADVVRGLGPAASSGAGGEVAHEIAPNNPVAQIVGELIGGVVPSTAMSAFRAVTRPAALTAEGAPVPRKLTDAVQRDAVPLDQVPQKVADLGPAGTVADLGDNTQKLAMGIATQPGAPGATISNAMKARAADSTNRVPAAVNDALGPAVPPSEIAADIKTNKQTVGPEYDQVLATAAPVDPAQLAASIDQQIATKKGPARTALQQVRAMLNVNGANASDVTDRLDTTASGLFETRNAVDGMISPTGNPKVNGALKDIRTQIDALLEQSAPGIKEIDAKYRELSRQKDALDAGNQVLDGGKSAVWPTDNAKAVAEGVQPEGTLVGPSAATFRLSQGARADIERIVGTKTNDRVALANIIQGESDWNPQKLAQLFGQDRADKIMQIVDNERRMAETENLARTGSKTAAGTAAQRDLNASVGHTAADIVRAGGWGPANAAAHAAGSVIDAITNGSLTRRNQRIADALVGPGNWTPTGQQPFFSPAQRDAMMSAIFSAGGGASR